LHLFEVVEVAVFVDLGPALEQVERYKDEQPKEATDGSGDRMVDRFA